MGKRVWTKEKIIEELKQFRIDGPKYHPRLYSAAKKHFGSYSKALKIAGLLQRNKWSKQLVIEAIRQRHQNGESLIRVHREDRRLYAAASKWHGNWTTALKVAGFPKPRSEFYTGDEVRLRIIDLYERELPLTLSSQKDLKLSRSARKHFGGWRKAVISLGLEHELPRKWTYQRVIDAIKFRIASGLDIGRTSRDDQGLFGAAYKHFGSWNKALEAVGIEQRKNERWTDEKIIARLQHYDLTLQGKSIRKVDRNLVEAAIRRFGTIAKAIEVARAMSLMRRWSKERVILEIQFRYAKGELSFVKGISKTALGQAAKRLFGSWEEAVEAAGHSEQITTYKQPRRWTADEVITAIRREYASGKPISAIGRQVMGLENAAKKHFGKLSLAVKAAGLEPRYPRWSQASVIAEIKRRFKDGKSLSCEDRNNANLFNAAQRYCGSWSSAKKMAGVPALPKGPRKRS